MVVGLGFFLRLAAQPESTLWSPAATMLELTGSRLEASTAYMVNSPNITLPKDVRVPMIDHPAFCCTESLSNREDFTSSHINLAVCRGHIYVPLPFFAVELCHLLKLTPPTCAPDTHLLKDVALHSHLLVLY